MDAKDPKKGGAWRTATVGLLVKTSLSRQTTLKRKLGQQACRVRIDGIPTSMIPVLQARIHAESNPNFEKLLDDF